MLGRHIVCDECGERLLDVPWKHDAYPKLEDETHPMHIIHYGGRVSNTIKGTSWVRERFSNPDDPIQVQSEDYCPDCAEER